MDWKWNTSGSYASVTGGNIIYFYLGDKYVMLSTKNVSGNGVFYIYGGSSNYFGMTTSSQTDGETIAQFPASEQGNWIHITVDFDFKNGTIDVVMEGKETTGTLSTTIVNSKDVFAGGLNAIGLAGSTKGDYRTNYFDNITLTPIMTKEPTIEATGNKLMWKAITGATSYNVYSATTANGTKEAVTVKNLDTTSVPGYVIATLGFSDDAAKYYTVTATSANKGESYNSNVLVLAPQNIISNADIEMTSDAEGNFTASISVNVDAAKGFGKKIQLIAAVYDDDELIKLAESELTTFARGTEASIGATLSNLSTPADNMYMKFFVWDEDIDPVKLSEQLTAAKWNALLADSDN